MMKEINTTKSILSIRNGGTIMSFVVIVEPEEANAERIRAILEAAERSFDYELVTSPERAIDIVEEKKVDVFISDMEMPIMTGSELFSMIEMISPDTIRVAMTDAKKITETVAFMNECRAFKVIIKPCRVADDLLSPITASIEYKEMKQRIRHDEKNADMGIFSTEHDYKKMDATCRQNERNFIKTRDLFVQMISSNLEFGSLNPKVSGKLKNWYEWMLSEYMENIALGSGNLEESVMRLKSTYHHPDSNCIFQIKKTAKEKILPEKMNELSFLLHLMAGMCHRMLYKYKIQIIIETVEKAYILRFSCKWKEISEPDEGVGFREPDESVRKVLFRAAEACVDAFGYKSVILDKEEEVIVNIAVRR